MKVIIALITLSLVSQGYSQLSCFVCTDCDLLDNIPYQECSSTTTTTEPPGNTDPGITDPDPPVGDIVTPPTTFMPVSVIEVMNRFRRTALLASGTFDRCYTLQHRSSPDTVTTERGCAIALDNNIATCNSIAAGREIVSCQICEHFNCNQDSSATQILASTLVALIISLLVAFR